MANSLVGSNPGDGRLGSNPGDLVGSGFNDFNDVTSLSNGNYVVPSPFWNGHRGAATWGNGSTGVSGTVSAANSLVGSNPGDYVGYVLPLRNGNYLVISGYGGRGAVTWVSGTTGQTLDGRGTINPQNSLVGNLVVNSSQFNLVENSVDQTFVAAFTTDGGGRVTLGFTDPSRLTYATGQSQNVSITPAFLNRTLNTGTAVVLQASNDITVNSPITVAAGGSGGALTLQAGRSILLNAPITTDNGALTLIANDQLVNGVVDAQRNPGNAVITMAPGTALDAGSGTLTVELGNGAGLTNRDSGAITLQAVTAGSAIVINNGPRPGSDVKVGPVTTRGSQYYVNPNGTTTVAGNLTTAGSSITFTDSVVVNDNVTVTAGANASYFVGNGTQTLQSGSGSSFGSVNHTATGTLRLKSALTVTGSFINGFGVFDANDQPVTVTGAAAVLAGTYLAGTAPQIFKRGVAIARGLFGSSTGPMSVTGPIKLLGGSLNGVGTVDSVAASSGSVAPGGNSPGVLTVRGTLTVGPAATLSILLKGTGAGTGYAQLQAGGLIDLGGSTLSLNVAFAPPVGSSFEVLTNTGTAPITGTFKGLVEGAVFSQGGYQFQITYQGGTGGNSVVLMRLA
jgi:hypothetical protein